MFYLHNYFLENVVFTVMVMLIYFINTYIYIYIRVRANFKLLLVLPHRHFVMWSKSCK